jgi:signal transduction histidine kinase
MRRTVKAKLLRAALVTGGTFVLLVIVIGAADLRDASEQLTTVLPFLAVGVAAAAFAQLRPGIDRVVERFTHYHEVTPYSALADAAQRLRSPSLDQALPGLARAIAEGTRARRATIWLAVGDRLAAAASYPSTDDGTPDAVENLALLLIQPGISHLVPVLDGSELRAVLSIKKPEMPITSGDRVLMEDVANGAAVLLRTVALNAELSERVRRADQLADALHASRQRLALAREVERRRLLTELSRATSGRLAALRDRVAVARADLGDPGTVARRARDALDQARFEVDELLDRFRVIARGVYPAVLRGQGPGPALEELAADLRRPVRLTGDLDVRLTWEIESAIYQVTAAALEVLAAQPAMGEIKVTLIRAGGRVRAMVEDPSPSITMAQLRATLTDDVERLVALGGNVQDLEAGSDRPAGDSPGSALRLIAWLPERLDVLADPDALAELAS